MCLKSRIKPTITPVGFDIRLQSAAVRVVAGFQVPANCLPVVEAAGLCSVLTSWRRLIVVYQNQEEKSHYENTFQPLQTLPLSGGGRACM